MYVKDAMVTKVVAKVEPSPTKRQINERLAAMAKNVQTPNRTLRLGGLGNGATRTHPSVQMYQLSVRQRISSGPPVEKGMTGTMR